MLLKTFETVKGMADHKSAQSNEVLHTHSCTSSGFEVADHQI